MSYIVGLTGGIGSGKTVASDHFATLGVPVIDTDVIARKIVEPGKPALSLLVNEFGEQILSADGSLNRDQLRQLAFANKENKARLDAITHPAIRADMFQQVSQVTHPYCIIVIPLLVPDSSFSELLQRILVVTTELETKIMRVMKRSNLSRQEVTQIMATQITDEERLKFADDVIANDGTIADAQEKVEELHQQYLILSASYQNIDSSLRSE